MPGRKQKMVLDGQSAVCPKPILFLITNDKDRAANVAGSVQSNLMTPMCSMVMENTDDRKVFPQGLNSLLSWSVEW